MSASLQEALEVFDEAGEPCSTTEVAAELDCCRRTTYARLERLVENDRLQTKKVGANARVWWRPAATTREGRSGQEGQATTAERDRDGEHGPNDATSDDGVGWERQFRSLIQATEEYAIFMLDADGYVRTWSPGAERIKGYEEEEILGSHFSTFYTDEDRGDGVPDANLTAAREDGSVIDEGWRVRADGSRFWANVTITAIRDDGDLVGFAKVTKDMTDRLEVERQLREEKAFAESLLDSQQDLLYAFDAEGTILRWNHRLVDVSGYSDADIETMHPLEFVPDRVVDDAAQAIERVVRDGEDVTVELPLLTADGEEIPHEFTGGPLTDDDGDIVGMTGMARDISDRKARERRLERQRDDLERELDEVFERIDDGVFALDESFRVTYLNDRAEDLLELEESSVIGHDVRETVIGSDRFASGLQEAFETQESVTVEEYLEPLDGRFESRLYPSESGLSVHVRDVTDRWERNRELERYAGIIDAVNEPVYELDAQGRITFVNDAFVEYSGYDEDELLGEHVSIGMDEETIVEIESEIEDRLSEAVQDSITLDYEVETTDGERRPVENRISLLTDSDGQIRGSAGVLWDVTERRERELELERRERRFRTLVDNFPNGAVTLVDEDLRYTTFRGTPAGDTDLTREDIEGGYVPDVLTTQLADVVVEPYRDALDGFPSEFEARIDDNDYRFQFLPIRDEDGAVVNAMGISQDITARKDRERDLQQRIEQGEAVAGLGKRALEDTDLDDLLEEATALVVDTLDNDYCKVLELDDDADELLLREGVGWTDGVVGTATVSAVDDDSQAAYTLTSEEPVIVEDLSTERRFSGPDLLREHDVHSGISVILGAVDDPWGILGTHDTDRTEFSHHDATFVQSVANVIAAAVDRNHYERELVDQHERLAAQNSLNEVVQDIAGAVIDQSTRDEIEATVVERLAASDSYEFAWIGDVDAASQTVNLRAEAGVEGYLDDVTITVDPDDERSEGPTGRAFRTGDVNVVNDTRAESRHDPWRDTVREYDFRSSAAIPIGHDDTVYGVLNVYARRPNAFTGQERTTITQLGDLVGHAIAATERKQALLSDDLVELEFTVRDVFGTPDGAVGVDPEGTITFDNVVHIGDDQYLVYGTATPDGLETLREWVAHSHKSKSVTVRSEGDPCSFELRLSDSSVISAIAARGGYVERAVVEDGDLSMTIHLATTVNVRHVIEAVESEYPDAQMLRRRQITRDEFGTAGSRRHLLGDLTDRQRSALQAAVHSGYFEWPREATGQEVAAALGVSPATFSQHIRKGQQKVLEPVFSSSPGR